MHELFDKISEKKDFTCGFPQKNSQIILHEDSQANLKKVYKWKFPINKWKFLADICETILQENLYEMLQVNLQEQLFSRQFSWIFSMYIPMEIPYW